MMARNSAPSLPQLEKLIGFMEVRSDLATGHARTANARSHMRNGWAEIAMVLNSVGVGCIKDWKQWAKYWKDKKAATKRKANIAETARRRTGGGVDVDIAELSELEQKILTISGGLSFATGDRNVAINPFPEQGNAVQEALGSETSTHSESILQQLHNIIEADGPTASATCHVIAVEDPQREWDETAAAVVGDTVAENLQTPREVEQMESQSEADRNVSVASNARRRIMFESPRRRRDSTVPQQRRRTPLTTPRGAARRRRLLRSPPSQRRSDMASLTERFIAIEERRAEAELAAAQARQAALQGHTVMAAAIDRFTETMRDVTQQAIRAILHFRAPDSSSTC